MSFSNLQMGVFSSMLIALQIFDLKKLNDGSLNKLEIICAVRYSKEGRENHVEILGLRKRFIIVFLFKIPFLGSLLKCILSNKILWWANYPIKQVDTSVCFYVFYLQCVSFMRCVVFEKCELCKWCSI